MEYGARIEGVREVIDVMERCCPVDCPRCSFNTGCKDGQVESMLS